MKLQIDQPTSVIAFDFDGVISNSIHDSFVTAINSYLAFVPGHKLPASSPIEPAERIFEFEKEKPEFFAHFKSLLPMGNRAEDYYVILQAIERNLVDQILVQENFDRFKKSLDQKTRDDYDDFFYRFRIKRQDADPETWARLLPAFSGIPESIQELSKRFILVIATAKDRRSVELQLRNYGLTDCFAPENILDKNFSESKRGHLIHIHHMHSTPYQNIHFIDDKVLHLLDVEDLGVNCYLSLWGYNSEREHTLARQHGFTLLKLDQLRHIQ